MGKKKKYLIKSINFGDEEEPARILIEKFLKIDKSTTKSRSREQELSNLIRKMVVVFLSKNKQFEDWKKEFIIAERKILFKESREKIRALQENEKELEKFGISKDDIDYKD